MKTKTTNQFTPVGILKFAHLQTPDYAFNDKDGSYNATVAYAGTAATDLRKLIDGAMEKSVAIASEDLARRGYGTIAKMAGPPYKVMEDGSLWVKFKSKARGTDAHGVAWERSPHIVDAQEQPVAQMIGSDSRVRVCYQVYTWHNPAQGAGVRLTLIGVQVVELIPYAGSKPKFGAYTEDLDEPESGGGEIL